MKKRSIPAWGILLAIGILMLFVTGGVVWVGLGTPGLDRVDTRMPQPSTTADARALAETLGRSVVYVPAGDFSMGSDSGHDDERPQHLVYLDAFEIDRFEVTNVQYQRFLRAEGRSAPPYWDGNEYPVGQADYPVVGVSWADADAYCAWAGKRLPTEAEWEKACRGTDGRLYPWGEVWEPQRANVDVSAHLPTALPGTSQTRPEPANRDAAWPFLRVTPASAKHPGLRPVGSYPAGASPYGVMDMSGNASEWVADWYNWGDYTGWPARNPQGLGPPWNHSLRGSAWASLYGDSSRAQDMSRCSARSSAHIAMDPRVGLRCARSIP